MRTDTVCCFRCSKTLGFKLADGHGPGPIWCFECLTPVAAEHETYERLAAEYRANLRVST